MNCFFWDNYIFYPCGTESRRTTVARHRRGDSVHDPVLLPHSPHRHSARTDRPARPRGDRRGARPSGRKPAARTRLSRVSAADRECSCRGNFVGGGVSVFLLRGSRGLLCGVGRNLCCVRLPSLLTDAILQFTRSYLITKNITEVVKCLR